MSDNPQPKSEFIEMKTNFGIALWLALGPLTVVVTLLGLRNVWMTFCFYHVVICLLLPLLDTLLLRGCSLGDHLQRLGLSGAKRQPTSSRMTRAQRKPFSSQPVASVATGFALGLVMGMGTIVVFKVWGEVFLAGNRIREVLAGWGVAPAEYHLMIAFMIAGNGVAEELFWRGYIHNRLEKVPRRGLAIGITALAYTSYHVVTLGAFLAATWLIGLCSLVVLAAGLIWGWLRERYGNVWPALLGHAGATVGYMVVFWNEVGVG